MPKNLVHLIKASGNTGVAGQSFRNHVTGAATGVAMTDYNIASMNLTGDVPDGGTLYSPADHTYSINIGFTEGNKAGLIRRLGNVVTAGMLGPFRPGASVSIVSSNIVVGSSGSTVGVKVVAGYTPGATPIGVTGGGSTPCIEVQCSFSLGLSGAGASGDQHIFLEIDYFPDLAPFNPLLFYSGDAWMANRAQVPDDYEQEWHTNGSYTALHSTAQSFSEGSMPQSLHQYYLRARLIGAGSWTNVGLIEYFDTRLEC